MQRRWPSDAEGLKGVPKRSWPDVQPEASEIPLLKAALEACVNEKGVAGCDDVLFTLATACVGDKDSAETGLQLYYEAAKRGHADSMCALGQCHELGFGVKANDKLAFRWYEQAAVKHEHANAMYELGVLYFIGDSVEEDERQAVELFLAAAKQGHAGAMYLLGDCLLEGAGGIAKDKDKALRWLIHAGDAGHRGARSRVFALTDPVAHPETSHFTDASRQSLRKAHEA
ncbi:hypothetical protein M885DRAFT_433978 [Pelagophyceae sp. CCMP2097]|nr:hypothetical protein M885DRAFT_433978 [Pelagophyceae sp. CCMP2097]